MPRSTNPKGVTLHDVAREAGVRHWEHDAIGLGSRDPGKHPSAGALRKPAYVKFSVEAAPSCGPSHLWEKEMPEKDAFEVNYVRVYRKTP